MKMHRYLNLVIMLPLAVGACKKTDSDPKVVDGIPAGADEHKAIVYIEDIKGTPCTGVFITPRIMLTAAHCLTDKMYEGSPAIDYRDSKGKVHKGTFNSWDQYDPKAFKNDLAMVTFKKNVAPDTIQIADGSVGQDERVTFVGYGERENGASGRKFVGTNQIAGEQDGDLFIRGRKEGSDYVAGEKSMIGHGDSGGALLNKNGELVGISTGGIGKDVGFFVNIHNEAPRKFMDDTMTDMCVKQSFCLPCFGLHAAKWVFKLTDEGVQSLTQATESAVRLGSRGSQLGGNFALDWVDEAMRAADRNVKSAYRGSFTVDDALDHYFYKLAKDDFYKTIEASNVDAHKYVSSSYESTIQQLNTPGRCGGVDCSTIYKLSEPKTGDDYISALKGGAFRESEVLDKLPNSLRPLDAPKTVKGIFQCGA